MLSPYFTRMREGDERLRRDGRLMDTHSPRHCDRDRAAAEPRHPARHCREEYAAIKDLCACLGSWKQCLNQLQREHG